MDKFKELNQIIDKLLGPEGCPWDREQTLKSMRSSSIEEAYELCEAIDSQNTPHILEEIGDLFFNAVFLSKLAEKEKLFLTEDVLTEICDKLIRRHPHVFGEGKLENSSQVLHQWEQIKKREKGKEHRKSALDSIPNGLPAMMRAEKVTKKASKAGFKPNGLELPVIENEDDLGNSLLALVVKAKEKGISAEHALGKALKKLEKDFREFEGKGLDKE